MKRKIIPVITILVVLFICYTAVKPQTQPTFSIEPKEKEEVAKKKHNPLAITIRSGFAKEFEAPNGITLIHKPTVINFTKVTTEREFNRFGKIKFEFAGTLATPNDFNASDSYGILEISSTKKFKNFEVGLKTSHNHSQRNPFAIGGIEFSKRFNDTEEETKVSDELKARIFSNASYYTKTQSGTSISSALVVRNGLETEFGFKRVRFEGLVQVINDFGAIRPGKRFSVNGEMACLVPIYGNLYVGPKFGYTRYFIYDQSIEHLKTNKFNWGIGFTYFR